MHEKTCACCGRKYLAKTRRSKYCCDNCRSLGNYREKKGIKTASIYMGGFDDIHIPTMTERITKQSVVKAVVALKGDAAFFDAAAKRGPDEYRQMCGVVSRGVLDVLRGLGL